MTLLDVLKLMGDGMFPPTLEINKYSKDIDTRPLTSYKVTICFMCEEETWLTCNIQNEILVPWYDCEVKAIEPGDDDSIMIWLNHIDYLSNNWPQHLYMEEMDKKHEE